MWAPWQTQETLDMLESLRSFNTAHPGEMVRVIAVASDRRHGLAEQTLAWRDRTGDKIVYLGGIAHTAVCRTTLVSIGPAHAGIEPGPNDGSALRDRLGPATTPSACCAITGRASTRRQSISPRRFSVRRVRLAIGWACAELAPTGLPVRRPHA
jgi:hypothetical protein